MLEGVERCNIYIDVIQFYIAFIQKFITILIGKYDENPIKQFLFCQMKMENVLTTHINSKSIFENKIESRISLMTSKFRKRLRLK